MPFFTNLDISLIALSEEGMCFKTLMQVTASNKLLLNLELYISSPLTK